MFHDLVNLSETIDSFEKVGARARRRLYGARFIQAFATSAPWIGLAILFLVLVNRLGPGSTLVEWWLVAGGLVLWIVGVVISSCAKKLTRIQSLAVWDEQGGWKDCFASALFFCRKPEQTTGELRHIESARAKLSMAESSLPLALPMPKVGIGWLVPLVALAFALSPFLRRPVTPADLVLTETMTGAAAEEAEILAQEKTVIDELAASLDEQEKDELDQLKSDVDEVVEKLGDTSGQTAREVLEALEERARAAERLARKLGSGHDEWASAEFLAELIRYADTTDLAAAVQDKQAEAAAAQADLIYRLLDNSALVAEVQTRVTMALDRSMPKASEEDLAKPVGEHLGNATRKLQEKSPKTAARDFLRLADHFRQVEQREEAQEKLEQLAEKLRESGSKISGSQLEKMEMLASAQSPAAPPAGLQSLGEPLQNLQAPMTPSPSQSGAAEPGEGAQGAPSMIAGAGQEGQGNGQKGQMSAGGKGEKGTGDNFTLMAPIPGMEPGSAFSVGMAAGISSGRTGVGHATTETALGDATESSETAINSQVAAMIGEEGDSAFRAIQGGARAEQAGRSNQQIAADFIRVEEQALDEATLPLSRRDHVLKYFTALRESFPE